MDSQYFSSAVALDLARLVADTRFLYHWTIPPDSTTMTGISYFLPYWNPASWSQVLLEIDQPSFQVITSSDQLEAWAKLIRSGISTSNEVLSHDNKNLYRSKLKSVRYWSWSMFPLIPGLTATVQQYAPRTSVVRPGISPVPSTSVDEPDDWSQVTFTLPPPPMKATRDQDPPMAIFQEDLNPTCFFWCKSQRALHI